LNGGAKLPVDTHAAETFPQPPAPLADMATIARGKALWDENGCELCHGVGAIGGLGSVGDLRRTNAATYELFADIVRRGLYKDAGMPVFADTLTDEDLPALKAYLISVAWQAYREAPQAR
jgi:quinohemoprotein ethanol dehydrogenase